MPSDSQVMGSVLLSEESSSSASCWTPIVIDGNLSLSKPNAGTTVAVLMRMVTLDIVLFGIAISAGERGGVKASGFVGAASGAAAAGVSAAADAGVAPAATVSVVLDC